MPSMRRKRKSKFDLEILSDIHASIKSVKAAKNSPIQVMAHQEEADPTSHIHEDVGADLSECNTIMTRVDRDSAQLMTESSLSPDPIATETTGSLPVSSLPDLETIFSPNFENDDPQVNPVSDINGVNIESDLPCLIGDETDDGICFSTDLQTCSLLDFCNFGSVSDFSFDISMGFTDVFSTGGPNNGLGNSDILIDMTERILPYLEKAVKTVDDQNSIQETMCDDACPFLAIQEPDMCCLSGDIEEMDHFDPHLVDRTLPDLPEALSCICPLILPNETQQRKPVTLVLDLDETLVHSTLEHCEDADFSFPVFFDAKYHTVYVRRRPHLQTFLERVAQWFEIVIFTASQSIYASKLLDILDPERKIISKRVYREACIFSDGGHTKDLRILELDLAKVAIIDNSPQVFRLQVNNGIPIKSWFDDPIDSALLQLLPFLETLVDAEDVRPIIAEKFSNIE